MSNMAIQVGESIGHYQIVEELGVGGNGRVLKVQHLITRRREAMKILANGRPNSQEYAHRVLREIRLQASLDHPNIAAVLNAFWLEDDLVMIMELIDGVTLQKILERRRLNLEQSLNLIRQVLLALSYAHSNGVIHRDVSTGNIIVTEDGRVKLTDFGLAKGAADLNVTDSGGMVGSPYYISPEQVRGTAASDQRSDIYSTGVVLYELVTGSKPFAADSTFALMQAHVQMRPQPPLERNAAIPQFINDAILKAMSKNPRDRFQSVSEFLAALEGPAEPVTPVHSTAPEIPAPPTYSHSFAAPLPPEDSPTATKSSIGAPAWKKILTHPAVGALLGIVVVLAAVGPVFFYDFESGRPRFGTAGKAGAGVEAPAGPPDVATPRTAEPASTLTPGPKSLPTLPAGSAAQGTRRSAANRAPRVPAAAAPPPPIVVWGEARTSTQPTAPTVVPTPKAAPLKTEKMEEPPVLPAGSPQASIEPALPATGETVQRKGLLRRIANGVRVLNPIRKQQQDLPAESVTAKP